MSNDKLFIYYWLVEQLVVRRALNYSTQMQFDSAQPTNPTQAKAKVYVINFKTGIGSNICDSKCKLVDFSYRGAAVTHIHTRTTGGLTAARLLTGS